MEGIADIMTEEQMMDDYVNDLVVNGGGGPGSNHLSISFVNDLNGDINSAGILS